MSDRAHLCEPVERRLLLTTDVRFVPDPLTGNGPESFAWDRTISGGTVADFSPAQREILGADFDPSNHQIFLKLTGIAGESIDGKHQGEIDIAHFEWGGDRTVGGIGPDFSELHLVSRLSKASPLLMNRLIGRAHV